MLAQPNYSLRDLIRYFLWLGTPGFGGPVALVNYMRRDLLSAYDFRTIDEVRLRTTEWMYDYCHLRPHKALGYRPPVPIQP